MKFAEGSLETRGKQDFPAATVPGGPQRSGGAEERSALYITVFLRVIFFSQALPCELGTEWKV